LDDAQRMEEMRVNGRKHAKPHAAETVMDTLLKLSEDGSNRRPMRAGTSRRVFANVGRTGRP
jgi:hypothetical protein